MADIKRDENGRIVKGSGAMNPGGRPKSLMEWRQSPTAQRLRELSYEALEEAVQCDERRDRLAAAKELLNRIEGMPVQAITGADGGPIRVLDVARLTVEQLAQLQAIRRAMAGDVK